MLNLQGKGVMTTFWLLGEEGSEEGETLKEEEEEEEEHEEGGDEGKGRGRRHAKLVRQNRVKESMSPRSIR